LGRTIPSFRMVMDREIALIEQTYGKKLETKRDREELDYILQLSKRHSHACSEAVRLIPMHAILMAILLEEEKTLSNMEKLLRNKKKKKADMAPS